MIPLSLWLTGKAKVFLLLGVTLCLPSTVLAQADISAQSKALYDQIKAFSLTGGSAEVAGLSLKRDRLEMTFDGTFYFTAPVQGHVTGAVFFGSGKFSAAVPPSEFEKDNVKRPLGKVMLTGTVTQENVPNDWFMILPVVISFGGKQEARGTVHALGPKGEFQIKLPGRPAKVELDPHHWIISEKTSTSGR